MEETEAAALKRKALERCEQAKKIALKVAEKKKKREALKKKVAATRAKKTTTKAANDTVKDLEPDKEPSNLNEATKDTMKELEPDKEPSNGNEILAKELGIGWRGLSKRRALHKSSNRKGYWLSQSCCLLQARRKSEGTAREGKGERNGRGCGCGRKCRGGEDK